MISDETAQDEVRQAIRFLVQNPLLQVAGRHQRMARLVHAHAKVLKGWFDEYLGWPLVIEREVIRLVKVPAEVARAHPDDAPSPRCCALFCLLLATLEDTGAQTVISEMAGLVTTIAASVDGIPAYDTSEYSERKALVQAIRLLTTYGVLLPVRGATATREDENSYAESDGNALYDVDHRAAALLLVCPTPPTRADGPELITQQPYPDTVEGANRRRRHALMRRLVDLPTMYFDELPDDQVDYFLNQRAMFVRQLRDRLGARLEVRAEGAAIVDDELTDLSFPKDTQGPFAALLFASALADLPGSADPAAVVSDETLSQIAERTAEHFAARGITTSSPRDVRQAALTVLIKLRLVESVGVHELRILPALGRFREVRAPTDPPQPSDATLFLPSSENPAT